MDSFVRNVSDINPTDRSVLEHLLGVPLADDQRVTFVITPATQAPAVAPSPLTSELPAWLKVYEGLSEAEADELHASITRADLTRHFE
jgi:hypothetical protein